MGASATATEFMLMATSPRTVSNPLSLCSSAALSDRGHKVSAKHLPAYLDEMTFRFNNRSNPYLFRDTLLKLLEAPVLEYKKLIEAA
jgi:hypothetical protein